MRVPRVVFIYAALILSVIIIGTLGTYYFGQSGQFNVKITPVNAFYFTVATISTVGYGDIVPVTDTAKIFVSLFILYGLGVFLSAITLIFNEFINTKVNSMAGKISYFDKIGLNNHVVLVGADSVNISMAQIMKRQGRNFIIITADKVIADRLHTNGYKAFVADATSEEDMAQFKLDKCKAIIIDLQDDSRTVYALIVVKSLAKTSEIFVVADKTDVEKHLKNLKLISDKRIINPAIATANSINNLLIHM